MLAGDDPTFGSAYSRPGHSSDRPLQESDSAMHAARNSR